MEPILILAIILGIAFVVVVARKLKSHLLELLFFGGIFGLAETYRFWGTDILGLPKLPDFILYFVASGLIFWSIMKILMVIGRVVPQLGFLSTIPNTILGGN